MKKMLGILGIALLFPTIFVSIANAETIYHYGDGTSGTTPPTSAQAAVGGFAVVNPETGVVHGIIAGSVEYFSNNNKTMNNEYMGCITGCLIVQQSTSDQNGNVAGVYGPNITYNQEKNIFQSIVLENNQTQTIVESASNSSAIETEVSVSVSARVYEFGLLDYQNKLFNSNEIAPPQNTGATISSTTKNFVCEESALLCSSGRSTSSNILVDESILFNERSTASQIETRLVVETKNKIKEQLSLILSMLERWVLN